MNYKILFGNLILLLLIILVIIFLIKDKIKESFFNTESCPSDEYNYEEGGSSGSSTGPGDYNPSNYYMCRNVGWQNPDTPYDEDNNQAWYDAEKQCKQDYRCNSFSFKGDTNETVSQVKYYTSTNANEIGSSQWEYEKPNLYIKTTEPCITTTPVTIYNKDSSGNLQSTGDQPPYKYLNKFITATRTYLNDYNDRQVSEA